MVHPVALNVLQNTVWNSLGNASLDIVSPKDAFRYGVVSSCAQAALPIASQALAEAVLESHAIELVFAPHAEALTIQLGVAALNRLVSAQIAVSVVNCFKAKGAQKLSLMDGLCMEAGKFGVEQAVKSAL